MSKTKIAKKRHSTPLFIFGALLIVAIVMAAQRGTVHKTESVNFLPHATLTAKTKPVSDYSDGAAHTFWDEHLNKFIMVQLVDGKHPVPAVNALYQSRATAIVKRYGKPYRIEPSPNANESDEYIAFGSDLKDGTPILRVFVPNAAHIYRELQSHDAFPEKDFESMVTVSTMHELDHISLGQIGSPTQSKEEFISAEAAAWAKTCEETISLFIANGIQIDASSLTYYNGWIACGRKNNELWKNFVERIYAPVAKEFL